MKKIVATNLILLASCSSNTPNINNMYIDFNNKTLPKITIESSIVIDSGIVIFGGSKDTLFREQNDSDWPQHRSFASIVLSNSHEIWKVHEFNEIGVIKALEVLNDTLYAICYNTEENMSLIFCSGNKGKDWRNFQRIKGQVYSIFLDADNYLIPSLINDSVYLNIIQSSSVQPKVVLLGNIPQIPNIVKDNKMMYFISLARENDESGNSLLERLVCFDYEKGIFTFINLPPNFNPLFLKKTEDILLLGRAGDMLNILKLNQKTLRLEKQNSITHAKDLSILDCFETNDKFYLLLRTIGANNLFTIDKKNNKFEKMKISHDGNIKSSNFFIKGTQVHLLIYKYGGFFDIVSIG